VFGLARKRATIALNRFRRFEQSAPAPHASRFAPARRKRLKQNPRRLTIALLTAATLVIAATQLWVFTGRFLCVEKSRLYRSAELPPDKLVDLCRRKGIRLVVDFRNNAAKAEAEAAALKRAGVRHVHLPTSQSAPTADVARFLEIMDASRQTPVLIHCTHGAGRTGVFTAIYRMEYQGWTARRAWIEELVLAGFGSFLPGSKKARRILQYSPRAAIREKPAGT
jgi:protein tyrosine phosphatase (PTP) superfamily phosphohydrolase (DUF442 family)